VNNQEMPKRYEGKKGKKGKKGKEWWIEQRRSRYGESEDEDQGRR
jgi:hypothetical protein